jgi:hypothetical protein
MKNIRLEKINFCSTRDHGSEDEQHLLAKRAFNILHPLFGHLADAEYTTFLEHVVCDPTPVVFRGLFMTDENNRDLGLVAVRIAETSFNGKTIAHFTAHLGLHPEVRGEKATAALVWKEIFCYRLRYPFRPFYIIDTPISAASYRKMHKGVAQLYPTPGNPIPENLWPLCESVAKERGWKAIEGCPKEARFVNRPLTELSTNDLRSRSDEYLFVEKWFAETTSGVLGSSVLIIVPITFLNILLSGLKQMKYFYLKFIN